jgi:hypothetical protein
MAYGDQTKPKTNRIKPLPRLHTFALVAPAVFAAAFWRKGASPSSPFQAGRLRRSFLKAPVFGADRAAPPPKEPFLGALSLEVAPA